MGHYFKPWRRKFGVAILTLACVCTALWMKSRDQTEFVWFSCRSGSVWFLSTDGFIRVMTQIRDTDDVPPEDPAPPIGWRSMTIDRDQTVYVGRPGTQISRAQLEHIRTNMLARIEYDLELEWTDRRQVFGFDFGTYRLTRPSPQKHAPFITLGGHYWSIVLSLTLLSAWLLCSPCDMKTRAVRERPFHSLCLRRNPKQTDQKSKFNPDALP